MTTTSDVSRRTVSVVAVLVVASLLLGGWGVGTSNAETGAVDAHAVSIHDTTHEKLIHTTDDPLSDTANSLEATAEDDSTAMENESSDVVVELDGHSDMTLGDEVELDLVVTAPDEEHDVDWFDVTLEYDNDYLAFADLEGGDAGSVEVSDWEPGSVSFENDYEPGDLLLNSSTTPLALATISFTVIGSDGDATVSPTDESALGWGTDLEGLTAYDATWKDATVQTRHYNGTVTGVVTGSSGDTLENATVLAETPARDGGGEIRQETVTDANGSYALELPEGEATLTAGATGYENVTEYVDIVGGERTEQSFTLPPVDDDEGSSDDESEGDDGDETQEGDDSDEEQGEGDDSDEEQSESDEPGEGEGDEGGPEEDENGSSDEEATGVISGIVVDEASSESIPEATVEVGTHTTTADNGTYTLEVPAGTVDVTASAPGYEATTHQVEVSENETTTRHFELSTTESDDDGETDDQTGPGNPDDTQTSPGADDDSSGDADTDGETQDDEPADGDEIDDDSTSGDAEETDGETEDIDETDSETEETPDEESSGDDGETDGPTEEDTGTHSTTDGATATNEADDEPLASGYLFPLSTALGLGGLTVVGLGALYVTGRRFVVRISGRV